MIAQNGDGGYNIDQEGVIGNLLRTKGLKDANSVRALIGDDCYDENLDGVEMLGASNKWCPKDTRVPVTRGQLAMGCALQNAGNRLCGA